MLDLDLTLVVLAVVLVLQFGLGVDVFGAVESWITNWLSNQVTFW